MTPRQQFIDVVRSIRSRKVRRPAVLLEQALRRAIDEAHMRGRLYAASGEKATPADEYYQTFDAALRAFMRVAP